MSNYLKLFNTHAEYSAFTQTEEFVRPNVSHCIQENEVHYNPIPIPMVTCKFNVTDASAPIIICLSYDEEDMLASNNFDKIIVDGVSISLIDLETNYGGYQLSEGEHTIVYYTKGDKINMGAFAGSDMVSVVVGDGITEISNYAFASCNSLTNMTIPNSVITLGSIFGDSYVRLKVLNIDMNTIPYGVFSNIPSIQTVILGENVSQIEDSAFCACVGLDSESEQSISSINEEAICDVTCMTVTYPSNVAEAYLPDALGYAFTGGDDIDDSEIEYKNI